MINPEGGSADSIVPTERQEDAAGTAGIAVHLRYEQRFAAPGVELAALLVVTSREVWDQEIEVWGAPLPTAVRERGEGPPRLYAAYSFTRVSVSDSLVPGLVRVK